MVFLCLINFFQSTLLQEERLLIIKIILKFNTFNPRSYKRSDNIFIQNICFYFSFNPRSYKRSDGANTKAQAETLNFQSTLLQEERQQTSHAYFTKPNLSIHAPTRGATFTVKFMLYIFSPFNPRSYKRSDSAYHTKNTIAFLSIHAPTRGATTILQVREFQYNFQSTLLQEERRT